MKNILVILFLAGLIFGSAAQNSTLPRFMTASEKEKWPDYLQETLLRGKASQPPVPVRTMAEWEELAGIQITWDGSFATIQRQIVQYAQEEGWVFIVCDDSNSVKQYLQAHGVPRIRWKFIQAPSNTLWCRDYGPWSVYAEGTNDHYIIDMIYNRPRPQDDQIPGVMANFLGVPLYACTSSPDNLVHCGGNYMVDGHGTAFMSKLILQENPGKTEAEIDDILHRYFGIQRAIKMDVLPYDVIHHIDMHMKLLDEETLLVGEYPPGVADGPQIEANLQYILSNFKTCYGRPYKVVRIPMPPDANGNYPNNWGDYRTYTNSIIVNKTVIVPTYEEKYDTTALRIYREAMPGYRVVGIDCNQIIPLLGAIHCITKEIGAPEPILISHAAIRAAADTATAFPVIAKIENAAGIDSALVFWSTDTTAGFNPLPMTALPGDSFLAEIPGQSAGNKVFYYISAKNHNGKWISKPLVAPKGCWTFTVDGVTALNGGANNSPADFRLLQNYPNPFNATTQITFYLDKSSPVELTIYNLLGEEIKTISTGIYGAGQHRVVWDGTDRYSRLVPSGVYLYRLRAGQTSLFRKMVLLK
ncbi:MAG: hypothetical protein Kow0037_27010 [Calditrichia bacterium]